MNNNKNNGIELLNKSLEFANQDNYKKVLELLDQAMSCFNNLVIEDIVISDDVVETVEFAEIVEISEVVELLQVAETAQVVEVENIEATTKIESNYSHNVMSKIFLNNHLISNCKKDFIENIEKINILSEKIDTNNLILIKNLIEKNKELSKNIIDLQKTLTTIKKNQKNKK